MAWLLRFGVAPETMRIWCRVPVGISDLGDDVA
jgi:hypothetical protein